MATRRARLYQGEDHSPIIDYTDQVIWEESEFGTRAWQGEGSSSTVVIRDPLGEQGSSLGLPSGLTQRSLASKNLFIIDLDDEVMFRGRVGIKNYTRDGQHVERYRQVDVSLHDTHWDLDHIFVHNYARPSETGNARVQGIIASYLSADPRPTTQLNGSNFLSGSNTIVLPAQTFKRTTPLGMIRETALSENKQFFITGDTIGGGSMFYDGNDSTVYQAGIRISDRPDEIDTATVCAAGDTSSVLNSGGNSGSAGHDDILVTVPAGSGGLVLAWLTHDAITSPSAIYQYDGATPGANVVMTLIGTVIHPTASSGGNTDNETLHIFWVQNPAQGINGPYCEVSWVGGTPNGSCLGYWAIDSSATPNVVGATGSGTSSSIDPSAGAGDLVLDVVGWRIWSLGDASNDPSPTASQTEDWSVAANHSAGQPDSAWGGGSKVGSGARTWSWTTSTNWVAAAVVIPSEEASVLATFPPIWNVGPASTEDGAEQLCEVVLFYGAGTEQYVVAHNLTVHTQYGHSSATITDDTIVSEAEATRRANSILAHRQYEDRTYNVTVGPLTDAQVLCVKHGQTINIKARAIPDADDAFRLMRVVQCRYTTPVVGVWFAHLQLGRPWKLAPYGTGGPLVPTSGAASDSTPEPIGVEGSPGTDNGEVAAADHVHAHGTISDIPGGTAHPASDVQVTPFDTISATNVQAALEEIVAEAGGGVSDHGALTGLGDDDHPQYSPVAHVHNPGEEGASIDGAAVHRTGGSLQNIPDQTHTALIFEVEDFDTNDYWDSGQPSRITIPADGWYEFHAAFRFSGEASYDTSEGKFFNGRFRIDGSTTSDNLFGDDYHRTISALSLGSVNAHGFKYLEAGQYVEVICYQNTGETLTVPQASIGDEDGWSRLFVRRVRDGGGAVEEADVRDIGRWEVIVSGTAPPVAVTNEAEDDWLYGWVSG